MNSKVKNIDLNLISSEFEGFYSCAMTDSYKIGTWPDAQIDFGKVLELRIFNEECEYKWFRGSIGNDFTYRYLKDDDLTTERFEIPIEEKQYITNCSLGERIRIKYYVPKLDSTDPSTIHAHVEDWRLVGFSD